MPAAPARGAPVRQQAPTQLGEPLDIAVVADAELAASVDAWQAAGIRFESSWSSAELALVIGVLDRYSSTFGYARVMALIRAGVAAGTRGQSQTLVFARGGRDGIAPAVWANQLGRIVLYDDLFDWSVMRYYFTLIYEPNRYSVEARESLVLGSTVGHEIGHVVIDGLRAEWDASRFGASSPETLYAREVNYNAWPHPDYGANESLASELALWALGVARPPAVTAFVQEYLAPLIISHTHRSSLAR